MAQQNINLYDSSLGVQRDWLSAESFVGAVGTAVLAVAAVAAFANWQLSQLKAPAREVSAALQTQQAAIQELATKVDSLRPDPALVADVSLTQATLEQRQAALQMLRAGGLGYQEGHASTLQAFARQSLDGLWLTGLTLDRKDLALRGRAMNPELIPAYVGRLNREPALQGRSFRALDIARPYEEGASAAQGGPAQAQKTQLASFVEFSLTGAGGAVVAGKEDKR